MASTLFIKFLSHFYERFSMHKSVFKLVWVSLAYIQIKFPYWHHKARVLIILAQGFFYWSLHFGFIWLHKGFVSIYIYFCVFISIVSPFLLSYLNSKVKWMMQVWLIIMICKFAMLWYASLSCYVMQVCHVMICKFTMLCYASLPCYDMQVYHVMLCKFAMLWYASLSCYVMQVCYVMICKFAIWYASYVMQVWVDHFAHVIMLCKLILGLWA